MRFLESWLQVFFFRSCPGVQDTCSKAAMEDLSVLFDGGNIEVPVNSSILMLASPVFKSMLTHSMKERAKKQIELPDKDPEEFKTLVSFLLPATGRCQQISKENVDFLLSWCDEYCIDPLKSECLEFIQTQPPSMQRMLQAHKFNLESYVEKCIQDLLRNGTRDWSQCYGDPSLTQKVLDRTMAWVDKNTTLSQDSLWTTEAHALEHERRIAWVVQRFRQYHNINY